MLSALLALGIVATICLQSIELDGPQAARAGAHTVGIALGFALGFGAYAVAAPGPAVASAGLSGVASAGVALVALRRPDAGALDGWALAAVTAFVVSELAWLLLGAPISPLLYAALLVLALYVVVGVCNAVSNAAAPRAYLELLVVTIAALAVIGMVGLIR